MVGLRFHRVMGWGHWCSLHGGSEVSLGAVSALFGVDLKFFGPHPYFFPVIDWFCSGKYP